MARPRPAHPVRPRRRLRTIFLASALALLTLLLGLGLATTCRPAWYRPAAIDRARLPQDKRQLVQLLDDIGGDLNAGRTAHIVLDEVQVNRWIAARAELWPETDLNLGPLRSPQVRFRDGRIEAAALVESARWRAVVAAAAQVEIADDYVAVVLDQGHLGSLPVPLARVVAYVAEHAPRHAGRITATGGTALSVPNDFVWPNGKRHFRVTGVTITPGRLEALLEPFNP